MAKPFDWDACLRRRRERLANLLALQAGPILLEREAQLVRKAILHAQSDVGLAVRDLGRSLVAVLYGWHWDLRVFWYQRICGLDEEAAVERASE